MSAYGVSITCSLRSQTGLSFNHDSYQGNRSKAPKRAKCSYCGGRMVCEPTVWAPVEWRRDGRYERPNHTYVSPERAQEAAVGEQVVRPFEPEVVVAA